MTLPFAKPAGKFIFASIILGFGLSLAEPQEAEIAAHPDVRVEVRIENRKVVGEQVIRLIEEQQVRIVWTTDEAAELHIHGYDIRIDISPDAPVETSFTAHATGRFAVTSHGFRDDHGHGHAALVYIEVYPK